MLTFNKANGELCLLSKVGAQLKKNEICLWNNIGLFFSSLLIMSLIFNGRALLAQLTLYLHVHP